MATQLIKVVTVSGYSLLETTDANAITAFLLRFQTTLKALKVIDLELDNKPRSAKKWLNSYMQAVEAINILGEN